MSITQKIVVAMLVVTTAQAAPITVAPTAGPGQPALFVPWPQPVPAPAVPPAPIITPPIITPPAISAPAISAPATTPPAGRAPAAATPVLRAPAVAAPTDGVPGQSHPGEGVTSNAILSLPAPLTASEVAAEVARLRAALKREVPGLTVPDGAHQESLLALAQAEWRNSSEPFDRAQLVVVVDRNPRVQSVSIVVARPEAPWEVLGGTRVSTGQAGRFDHYITPTGVFLNTADILGYRAEGTYNENHIRGLGVKGMRVWDFGWQTARKGWHGNGEFGQIRLEMHATDPEILAARIGRPASQGCIRIPEAVNRFLDRHGVLDADYERAAIDDIRYRALLLPNRVPTPLAGNALIIVDSESL